MKALFASLLLIFAVACAGTTSSNVPSAPQVQNLPATVAKLEAIRDRNPRSSEARVQLASNGYYLLARKALDESRQSDYVENLGKAYDELIEAARLAPNSPDVQTWIGIVDAYRDDLDASRRSFKNAQRFDKQSPVHDLNIAQMDIYQGKMTSARRRIKIARRKGSRGAYTELIECLAAWREGDLVDARDLFDVAYGLSPQVVQVWDEAPVSAPIESFSDFTHYCCSNHTCGPHMGDACKEMNLAVKHRSLSDETIRRELEIEMKRARELREIYKGRSDVQIDVEE